MIPAAWFPEWAPIWALHYGRASIRKLARYRVLCQEQGKPLTREGFQIWRAPNGRRP